MFRNAEVLQIRCTPEVYLFLVFFFFNTITYVWDMYARFSWSITVPFISKVCKIKGKKHLPELKAPEVKLQG